MLLSQVKDSNRVSGRGRTSCPHYDEIDAILGTRAASEPIVLLDSGADGGTAPQLVDKEALVGMEDEPTSDLEEEEGIMYTTCMYTLYNITRTLVLAKS